MSISYFWKVVPKPIEVNEIYISRELHRLLFYLFNESDNYVNESDNEFRHWCIVLTQDSIFKLKTLSLCLRYVSPPQKKEADIVDKMIESIRKNSDISVEYSY